MPRFVTLLLLTLPASGSSLGLDANVLVQKSLLVEERDVAAPPEAAVSLHEVAANFSELQGASADSLQSFSASFKSELAAFEEEQRLGLQDVEELHKYVHELKATFGRFGTVFGEMRGLAPSGRMSQNDEKALAMLLVPFRSQAFVRAVAAGLTKFGDETRSLIWRSEKHVANALRRSAQASPQDIKTLLTEYFRKEQHVMQSLLTTTHSVGKEILEAAPTNPVVKGIWQDLWDILMQKSEANMEKAFDDILKTNFEAFCGDNSVGVFAFTQALPIINRTASALPHLITFTVAKVPDVAPQVQEAANWLREILQNAVANLDGEVQLWYEKICGLAGSVAELSQW